MAGAAARHLRVEGAEGIAPAGDLVPGEHHTVRDRASAIPCKGTAPLHVDPGARVERGLKERPALDLGAIEAPAFLDPTGGHQHGSGTARDQAGKVRRAQAVGADLHPGAARRDLCQTAPGGVRIRLGHRQDDLAGHHRRERDPRPR
jgi:hypothetical protein